MVVRLILASGRTLRRMQRRGANRAARARVWHAANWCGVCRGRGRTAPRAPGCGMPRAGAAHPEALGGEIGLCGPDLVRLDPGVVIPEGAAATTVAQRGVTTMICQCDSSFHGARTIVLNGCAHAGQPPHRSCVPGGAWQAPGCRPWPAAVGDVASRARGRGTGISALEGADATILGRWSPGYELCHHAWVGCCGGARTP